MSKSKSWLILAVSATCASSYASTYYADALGGSDSNPGTDAQPFQTLGRCIGALEFAGDVCELKGGVYQAGGAVNASGTVDNPVVVRARKGHMVVIRDGSEPTNWNNGGNNLWSKGLEYSTVLQLQSQTLNYYERGIQLWRDSKPLTEACFPNLQAQDTNGMHRTVLTENGTGQTLLRNSQIPSGDLRGARAVVYPYHRLNGETRRVVSSGQGQVAIEAGLYYMEVGKPFYLEGAKALIDQDWEWAWDEHSGLLWIKMPAGMDPNVAKVRIQTSSIAFTLGRSSNVLIQGLRFEGVVPISTPESKGIVYDSLDILEPGLLRFVDSTEYYTQEAGLVVRDGAKVLRSKIEGCNGRCLAMAGNDILVENSIFRNGARLGQFEGAVTIQGRNAVFRSNLVENSGHDAISFMTQFTDGAIVRRNLLRNLGLQSWYGSGVSICRHPNGKVVVDSNLVEGVDKDGSGILIDEGSQFNEIHHNVVGGAPMGVFGRGDDSWSLRNNAIWHNTFLSGTRYSIVLRSVSNLSGGVIANNVTWAQPGIWSNPVLTDIRTTNSSEIAGYGTRWEGNLAPGVDPMLQDPSRRNFGLRPGSPAIERGILGPWAYLGTKPDIGAVESGTRQWVYGPRKPTDPPVSNPILGFESLDAWNPPSWDNAGYMKFLSTDKVEGASALAVTTNGYKVLESAPLSQADLGGTAKVNLSMKVSSQQPNPWWVGQVQIYMSCPSRNFWNQMVGFVDLTPLVKDQWGGYSLPIPPMIANALRDATYSDLRVMLIFNINAGAGPILLDNLNFTP